MATISKGSLLELFRHYVNDAKQLVAILRTTFGLRNLTAAVACGQIPRVGVIRDDTLGPISFQFHGRGCFISVGLLKIDIELCGESEMVGFDAWRLCRYASETLEWGEVDLDEQQVKLDQLCRDESIHFSKESPLFGLYFMTSEEHFPSDRQT